MALDTTIFGSATECYNTVAILDTHVAKYRPDIVTTYSAKTSDEKEAALRTANLSLLGLEYIGYLVAPHCIVGTFTVDVVNNVVTLSTAFSDAGIDYSEFYVNRRYGWMKIDGLSGSTLVVPSEMTDTTITVDTLYSSLTDQAGVEVTISYEYYVYNTQEQFEQAQPFPRNGAIASPLAVPNPIKVCELELAILLLTGKMSYASLNFDSMVKRAVIEGKVEVETHAAEDVTTVDLFNRLYGLLKPFLIGGLSGGAGGVFSVSRR